MKLPLKQFEDWVSEYSEDPYKTMARRLYLAGVTAEDLCHLCKQANGISDIVKIKLRNFYSDIVREMEN